MVVDRKWGSVSDATNWLQERHKHIYKQFNDHFCGKTVLKKVVFPYSLPNIGPGADPGVQEVSPQVTWSESRHRPGSRLPLLSAGPVVTSVAFTRWRYL